LVGSATTIMLETEPFRVFAEVGQFSSYCRCVDSRRESNRRKKGEGNTKNGNKYLAWHLSRRRTLPFARGPEARRFYERKKRARNRIVAIKAWRTSWHGLLSHAAGAQAI